jgi:hypothetical protein
MFTLINTTTVPPIFLVSAFGESDWGTEAPQILCPSFTFNLCDGDFDVTFSTLVNGLQFYFTGDTTTKALTVEAFLDLTSLGTLSVYGDGDLFTAQLVDLSGFGPLDSIRVTGALGSSGWGYDDFSFSVPAAAVSEPPRWTMMLLGFGAIAWATRRRRKIAAP